MRFRMILDILYNALSRRAKIIDLSIKTCDLVVRFSSLKDNQKQRNRNPSYKNAIKNDTVFFLKMRTLSAKTVLYLVLVLVVSSFVCFSICLAGIKMRHLTTKNIDSALLK